MKKTRMKYVLCVSVSMLMLAGCKKKDSVPGLQSGVWKYATPYGTSYMIFKGGGNVTKYTALLYNMHIKQNGHYTESGGQVEWSSAPGSPVDLRNYRISNDTLYLDGSGSTDVYVRTSETIDTANWVKRFTALEQYPLGQRRFGAIDFNGTDIFMSGYVNGVAYRISAATHTLIDSIIPSFSGKGLACVGSDLWLTNNSGKVFNKMNYSANSIISTSALSPSTPGPSCAYGSKILFMDAANNLRTYDPATSTYQTLFIFESPYLAGGFVIDLHAKGNLVYMATLFGFYVFDLNTHQFTESYDANIVLGVTEVNNEFYLLNVPVNGLGTTDVNTVMPYLIHVQLN